MSARPALLAARRSRRARPAPADGQRGLVLVTAMLFLVVVTLLALSLFRSSGMLERIAANTRDKQRAFESAQSALQYAEWWIGQDNGGVGSACTGFVSGNTRTNVHVCTNTLTTPAEVPWAGGFTYQPPNFNVNTSGGQTSSGDVYYQALPGFHIEWIGTGGSDGKSQVYRVTAYGYGGMAGHTEGSTVLASDTVSVVRSTYQMTPSVKDLGN